MVHTPALRELIRWLQQNLAKDGEAPPLPVGQVRWTRRQFVKSVAFAGAATTISPGWFPVTWAGARFAPRIAIVGAGIAGLNAAYQLKKAGYHASVYEARRRDWPPCRQRDPAARSGNRTFVSGGGGMTSATPTEKVPLIRVFLSSSGDGADERTRMREVVEGLPKDLLLASGFRFKVGIWDDSGPRFLAVIGTSGIGKPSPVDVGTDDAFGGAGQIR